MLLLSSLNLNDATDAEYVLAVETDRQVSYRETDWAKIVVELGDLGYELLRHLCADISCNGARQELVRVNNGRKLSSNSQRCSFVEFFVNVSISGLTSAWHI